MQWPVETDHDPLQLRLQDWPTTTGRGGLWPVRPLPYLGWAIIHRGFSLYIYVQQGKYSISSYLPGKSTEMWTVPTFVKPKPLGSLIKHVLNYCTVCLS